MRAAAGSRSNRLAIFDCDGTLVDSGATICRAMDDCFDGLGLPCPSDAATRRIIGLSLPDAMRVLHPEGDDDLHLLMADGYRRAFQTMRGQGHVAEPLYDGVVDALDALEQAGWLLGVATGKSDRGLGLILAHHGLAHRFVTLQTADRHPSKPHPSMIEQAMAEAGAVPETTAMIGDTSYDIAMARAAGVAAIGVAWGYHPADELRGEGADAVAGHPSALPALLETLR